MSEKKASDRPEARLPKGLFDTSAAEIRATERMLTTIRKTFESYAFEPLDTPAIEYSDALGKFLPDQDRPNEGVFSFKDAEDGDWLSLRYDLTAPLARYVAENYQHLPKPFRRYQTGPVWRNEKPGPGRFRQFTQFDADTVGASSVAADAELCMLAADTLEALGLKGEFTLKLGTQEQSFKRFVVKLSNRKVLDGVMEIAGLKGSEYSSTRLSVLRSMDKLDRVGLDGVGSLLTSGRMDESGDFTKGAGLSDHQARVILGFLKEGFKTAEIRSRGGHDNFRFVGDLKEMLSTSPIGCEGATELETIALLLRDSGYGDGRVLMDPSVVRGLEYYTGPVFEAELTAPIKDEKGQAIRLGSVVSGGRYDGLVERFTGEKVPATGISIGVSRLLFGLQRLGKFKASATQGPVIVLVLDRDRIADYQKMAQSLRAANISAEVYLGDAGLKAQMKYADKRGSPCVVIQGGDEKAKGEVQIKDLILGATLASIENRDEYLKKQAEAQFAVPEADLAAAVRKILARHKS
jgi:histidyl-tRNA synthetase